MPPHLELNGRPRIKSAFTKPPPLQIETAEVFEPLLYPSRYKGAHGGRGSAKSHFFAELLIERCVMQPTRFVCLREIQNSLKQSVKLLLHDKIQKFGLNQWFDIREDRIMCPGEGLIIFQGMQNHTSDTIKSLEGFDGAWFAEAQNASEYSLKILRPTIRLDGSEIWADWNPKSPKDPIDVLLRGPEPPPRTIVVESNYEDNPWFPDVLREEMEYDKRRDYDKYLHVWRGKYEIHSQARVFRNWRKASFETPANARFYFGCDWGFAQDPTVLVRMFIKPEEPRTLYIDREAWALGCEIDHTPALFAGTDTRPNPRWENPASRYTGIPEVMRWNIRADSANPQAISYMRRRGFNITPAIKGPGSIEEGVGFIKSYDVVIHEDNCPHVIDEFENYSYEVDKKTQEVLPILADKKNHVIDSVRYALELTRRASSTAVTGVYGSGR